MDFKLLFIRLCKVIFAEKEVTLEVLMRFLETRYGNKEYFVEGRKLYRGRGYKRVKEQLQAMKLLGILSQ